MIGAIIVIVGLAFAVGMFIEVRQTHKKNCTCSEGYCAWCHSGLLT